MATWAEELSLALAEAEFGRPFDPSKWEPHVLTRGPRKWLQVWKNPTTGAYRDELVAIDVKDEPTELQPITLPTDDQIRGGTFQLIPGASLNAAANRAGANIGSITVDGNKYFWKGVKGEYAQTEAIMSELGGIAGVSCLATRQVHDATLLGLPSSHSGGVVAEWCKQKTMDKFLSEQTSYRYITALEKLDPKDAQRHLLFSYLTNNTDSHSGNLLVENGKLTSIDHEYALGVRYKFDSHDSFNNVMDASCINSMLLQKADKDVRDREARQRWYVPRIEDFYPDLDKDIVRDMGARATQMADYVRNQPESGMTRDQLNHAADMIAERGQILLEWAHDPVCNTLGLDQLIAARKARRTRMGATP